MSEQQPPENIEARTRGGGAFMGPGIGSKVVWQVDAKFDFIQVAGNVRH